MAVTAGNTVEMAATDWPKIEKRWMVMAVFPTFDEVAALVEDEEFGSHHAFAYTVGLQEHAGTELWCPMRSIEGRGATADVIVPVINYVGRQLVDRRLSVTGNVKVLLSTPDHPDRDQAAWFWLNGVEEDLERREAHGARNYGSDRIVPMVWSSPLGWPT